MEIKPHRAGRRDSMGVLGDSGSKEHEEEGSGEEGEETLLDEDFLVVEADEGKDFDVVNFEEPRILFLHPEAEREDP